MKKIILATCVLHASIFCGESIVNDASNIGKSLVNAKFNNALIQNSSFAFANLADADFTSTPPGHTNIGNDVSFYCANLNGIKYDETDPALISLFNLQAAATQENFAQCQAVANYLGITLPYSKDDLPKGAQS